MAVNPFSGIISSSLKTVYNNAINALLDDSSLTIPCTLNYGITQYVACSNCSYDSIGQKSSNRYVSGGPIPFPFGGICPMCNGDGRTGTTSTEDIYLAVIVDPKQFISVGTVDKADNLIQTISKHTTTPKLQRAQDIIIATDISGYFTHRYERISEPTPVGLGDSSFVFCTWKRI